MKYPALLALAISCGAAFVQAHAATPAGKFPMIWGLEDSGWKYAQAGDVEHYLALFYGGFSGWTCDYPVPMQKALMGAWVTKIRDQKLRLSYAIQRKDIEDFGDVVVVFYSTPMTIQYPDGHVTGKDQVYKFTHTWMKVGSSWQIISGMCGSLDTAPAPAK